MASTQLDSYVTRQAGTRKCHSSRRDGCAGHDETRFRLLAAGNRPNGAAGRRMVATPLEFWAVPSVLSSAINSWHSKQHRTFAPDALPQQVITVEDEEEEDGSDTSDTEADDDLDLEIDIDRVERMMERTRQLRAAYNSISQLPWLVWIGRLLCLEYALLLYAYETLEIPWLLRDTIPSSRTSSISSILIVQNCPPCASRPRSTPPI